MTSRVTFLEYDLGVLNTGPPLLSLKNPPISSILISPKHFTQVSHLKLLHKHTHYGMKGKLFDWISSWFSNRTQTVKNGSFQSVCSQCSEVLSEVIQGSVFGSLLFLLFLNDILDFIPLAAHPTLFADDLKIFSDQYSEAESFSSWILLLPNYSSTFSRRYSKLVFHLAAKHIYF